MKKVFSIWLLVLLVGGLQPAIDSTRAQGLIGGYEFVYLEPHLQDNTSLFVNPPMGGMGGLGDGSIETFNYDYALAPRLWLGYMGAGGLGFQVTYFQYDQSADNVLFSYDDAGVPATAAAWVPGSALLNLTASADAAGEVLSVRSGLELHTLDMEAIQQIGFPQTVLTFTGGVRYATMHQDLLADVMGGGMLQEALWHTHDFEGAGPTASVRVRRRIGASAFALVGGLRGSILFGEANQQIKQRITPIPPQWIVDGEVAWDRHTKRHSEEELGMLDVRVGVDWSTPMGAFGTFFVQTGVEGQLWFDAGNANTTQGDLGLFGITNTFGVRR